VGVLGEYYSRQYGDGNCDLIGALAAEEDNLLRARSLARSHGWRRPLLGTMQGLETLYDHTGRTGEWSRLVGKIVPDFVDPATDGPLPGKEEEWTVVTGYRVMLARQARRWEEAERLQSADVHWARQLAASILAKTPRDWSAVEKGVLRTLAVSLEELSHIRREQGLASCVDGYQEALALAEAIQDLPAAAIHEFNLGRAFAELADIRDLALAEHWYQRSLERRATEDRMGRAACLSQLGSVAYERFLEAREANRPAEEGLQHLSQAARYYEQALDLTPADAPRELAAIHNQLGGIFSAAGQTDAALQHYRKSIRYKEGMGDRFGAGQTRFKAALALFHAGRFADALDWAQSALRDYQACENADQQVVMTLKLLELIESALRASEPPSSAHPPPPH
jgi:tetratricopeptide (TPR) repeat protein